MDRKSVERAARKARALLKDPNLFPDQQPIQRTVGKRVSREARPLTDTSRVAMAQNTSYRTRAPKGVFFYASHEEMAADRLRWTIDLMAERASSR